MATMHVITMAVAAIKSAAFVSADGRQRLPLAATTALHCQVQSNAH
jgi:hypothetical protein